MLEPVGGDTEAGDDVGIIDSGGSGVTVAGQRAQVDEGSRTPAGGVDDAVGGGGLDCNVAAGIDPVALAVVAAKCAEVDDAIVDREELTRLKRFDFRRTNDVRLLHAAPFKELP